MAAHYHTRYPFDNIEFDVWQYGFRALGERDLNELLNLLFCVMKEGR